jgi:transcriptional regulator with XRE-family HTH domain
MWRVNALTVPYLTRYVLCMASSFDPQAVAIGQAVRGAIAQAGLTQAEAAERADMSLRTLSRRINGLMPFTWTDLVRISEVTDVPCAELAASAVRIANRELDATA